MKQYTKIIDGKTVIKTRNQIVIKSTKTIKDKDGNDKVVSTNTYNPTEDMIFADGWVEYVIPEPTADELLERARRNKLREIAAYDKSEAVEQFTLKGVILWLDRAERETLDRRFRLELKNGKQYSTLWKNGMSFELNVEQALAMLDVLEMYAIETYDNTQRHLAAVNALTTIEEVEAYDYKAGYPEKLNF